MNIVDNALGIILTTKQGNGQKRESCVDVKSHLGQEIKDGDVIYVALLKKYVPITKPKKEVTDALRDGFMSRSTVSNCTLELILISLNEIAKMDSFYYVESIDDKIPILRKKSEI